MSYSKKTQTASNARIKTRAIINKQLTR